MFPFELTNEYVLEARRKGELHPELVLHLNNKYIYDTGSFSNVYQLDYGVLKININSIDDIGYCGETKYERLTREAETLQNLEGIEAFPTLYGHVENVIAMEKKTGVTIYTLPPEEIENIPDQSWLNIFKALDQARQRGYRPIDVNSSNIKYNKELQCFSIIDVGFYKKEHHTKLHVPQFLYDLLDDDLKDVHDKILTLLEGNYQLDSTYDEELD